MKKTLRMMGLVALAVLALTGCKKEQKNTVTFKATLPQPACEAKTHIGSGNWLMWNAGDQIKVYTADKTEANSAIFTTTDGNQITAHFSGTLAESELYYAFYPTTGVELNADGKFMLPVSATQTFVESNFTTNAFPMCATSTDGTFNFHSPYGILGIPMKGNATIGSIVLTDTTGMQLAGYYTMDATDTTFVGTSAAITLNFGTGVTLNTTTPTTAYFIVPAGVFQSGFNAAVRGIDGSTIFNLGTIQPNTILKESIHIMPETTVNATTPTGLTNALTLEALTNGTIVVNNPQSGMQYTLNGGAKTPVTSAAISVSTGDKVQFYGDGTSISCYYGTTIAGGTAQVKVYGDIMSLLDEMGYTTLTSLPNENNVFYELFKDNTTLTNASGLLLPATMLTENCYRGMFEGCTSLITAPVLPATTLADYCYDQMFSYCTSLTTAPALPATTLATKCYQEMFRNCTSLTTAPALPATTLADYCYDQMFSYCTSLTTAPALPATTLATDCYSKMFSHCTSLTTAPEMPATTLATGCYWAMFSGCTSLTTAPALPATTLVNSCYNGMFSGCTSLTTAPALPATTLDLQCYHGMFHGCTSLTTAPALPATTLAKLCYSDMFGQCFSLTTAPALPAITLAPQCYSAMFNGCSSLATAPALPATTLADYCYYGMFSLCTGLTTAPTLPATTLADYCYDQMFSYCTSLTTAPALPSTTLANHCYQSMFYLCTSLTTAPALPATTLADYCYDQMFSYCSSLATAPALPATTLVSYCYNNMFARCTSLSSITCLATSGINENNSTTDWVDGVASTGMFTKASGATWPTGNSGIPSGWTVVIQ